MEVAVATKFAALPWRFGRQSVITALKDSLCRLGLSSVDLYQLHWSVLYEPLYYHLSVSFCQRIIANQSVCTNFQARSMGKWRLFICNNIASFNNLVDIIEHAYAQIQKKLSLWGNHFSGYIDGLGDAVEMGLVKAVGVSNYSGTYLIFGYWLLFRSQTKMCECFLLIIISFFL